MKKIKDKEFVGEILYRFEVLEKSINKIYFQVEKLSEQSKKITLLEDHDTSRKRETDIAFIEIRKNKKALNRHIRDAAVEHREMDKYKNLFIGVCLSLSVVWSLSGWYLIDRIRESTHLLNSTAQKLDVHIAEHKK